MYVDPHTHIIPGIDDGAIDIRAASEMLRIASAGGTAHIIATPHFISGSIENDASLIREKCGELQRLANNEGLDIVIHPGSEVFISPDIAELYEKGIICTLNDSSYILIELPVAGIPIYVDELLYQLQLIGLTPILAHPERNRELQRDSDILVNLVKRGILAQVNSGSITGVFGKKVYKTVMWFIRMGLIQFVASDAHNCGRRSPELVKAEAIVRRRFGHDTAVRLFSQNGLEVLKNGIVPVHVNDKANGINIFFNRIRNKGIYDKGGDDI